MARFPYEYTRQTTQVEKKADNSLNLFADF